jgi:Uma2 family endonuclease
MASNAAVAVNLSEILEELGSISSDRVRREPAPGHATIDDLLKVHVEGGQFELVDGTLVEKAMGWRESFLAAVIMRILGNIVTENNLGVVSGPDGFLEILPSLVRGPDVTFISWSRLPGGRVPADAIPKVVPNLAVEVLSVGNTFMEMSRKRHEYFHAGVQLVWMVDLRERTIAVYTTVNDYEILDESETLTGCDVLPGLRIPIADIFGELDRQPPQAGL